MEDPMTSRPRHVLRVVALTLCAVVALGACQPTPPPSPGRTFTFVGGGWGHGVGMSQYGMLGMAQGGRSYQQILGTYYPGASLVTRAPTDNLRVLLAERAGALSFVTTTGTAKFGAAGTVGAGRTVKVVRSGGQLRLSGALNATVNKFDITWNGELHIAELGKKYRYGAIRVAPDPAGGVRAIVHQLTMNAYLYGVAEVPASWHAHALRAQVVAARTFAQKRRDSRAASGLDFDLLSTVTDQVYSGSTQEDPRWVREVNATNAQMLTYRGALIDAVYSSSNGGHSESSAYVWGGTVPYLTARPDKWDAVASNPNRSWTRRYTGRQLGSWFGVGTATQVTVLRGSGVSGRVDKARIRVVGTSGVKEMSGNEFRAKVNSHNPVRANQLLSTKFVVK
jgi:SpoIID/LytB domain protein